MSFPYTCHQCNKTYYLKQRKTNSKFCSKKCLGESLSSRVKKTIYHCLQCGKKGESNPCRAKKQKYCSRICQNSYQLKKRWELKKESDSLISQTEKDRILLDKIIKNLEENGECLVWKKYRDKDGYGYVSFMGSGSLRVHREIYRILNGKIPSGMFVCHSCDNPPCCNPKHLFLGTPEENTRDMLKKRRQFKKISNDDVKKIRELKVDGFSNKEIATKYNVNERTIWSITTGRSRKEV